MAKRSRIGKYYVVRDKKGRFKKWVKISRSLKRDKKSNAKRIVKAGYGHRGDVKRNEQIWF